jgi:hypothetical protein
MPSEDTRENAAAREDTRLQADPELTEGRASGMKILWIGAALLAIVVLLIIGLNDGGSGNKVATSNAPPATQSGQPAANSAAQSGSQQEQSDQNVGAANGTSVR